MDAENHRDRSETEAHHWFYRGKRDIVRYWLNHYGPVKSNHLLADCGAGIGVLAAEMSALCRVVAIESDGDLLEHCRERLGAACVRGGSCTNLPLPNASVDYLTAIDQIDHVENDRAAVAEFARVLKPGGIAIVTVSALAEVSSPEAANSGCFHHYTAESLLSAIEHPELQVRHWNYIDLFGGPLRWLSRRLEASPSQNKDGKSAPKPARRTPPSVVNELLRTALTCLAVQNLFHLPTGAGLLAVLERRNLAAERSNVEEELASSFLPIPAQCAKCFE